MINGSLKFHFQSDIVKKTCKYHLKIFFFCDSLTIKDKSWPYNKKVSLASLVDRYEVLDCLLCR